MTKGALSVVCCFDLCLRLSAQEMDWTLGLLSLSNSMGSLSSLGTC